MRSTNWEFFLCTDYWRKSPFVVACRRHVDENKDVTFIWDECEWCFIKMCPSPDRPGCPKDTTPINKLTVLILTGTTGPKPGEWQASMRASILILRGISGYKWNESDDVFTL